jgi:hypothetical protein
MQHHSFTTGSAGRLALVVVAAVAALMVAAPLANAARSDSLACRANPGHWVSVTDDLGIPNLELVGATVCTDAVTGQACSLQSARSPYPGWVVITDDLGIPYLYQTGAAVTTTEDCVQSDPTQSIAAGATPPASSQPSRQPMQSPYPGWVVVYDDLGIPWLEPISQFR